jgi:flagellar motor switch/type III secretory pathway protein FliN
MSWPLAVIGSAQMIDRATVEVAVELGHARMPLRQFLGLSRGAVFAITRPADTDVVLRANAKPVARGSLIIEDRRIRVEIDALVA